MFYMNLTNCELGLPHYQTGAHLSLMYDYLFSGPVIGSGLYSLGGFLLPFVTVGSVGIILAICLFFAIPGGEYEKQNDHNELKAKRLTWSGVFRVRYRNEHVGILKHFLFY